MADLYYGQTHVLVIELAALGVVENEVRGNQAGQARKQGRVRWEGMWSGVPVWASQKLVSDDLCPSSDHC